MNKKIKDNGGLMRDGQNEGESKRNGELLYLLKEKTIMGGRMRWVKSQHPVFSLSFGGFFYCIFLPPHTFFYSFQLSFLFFTNVRSFSCVDKRKYKFHQTEGITGALGTTAETRALFFRFSWK